MSSAARTTRPAAPLLEDGMRLTQPEFHRRYERYPDKTIFELIAGVVFRTPPAKRDAATSVAELCGLLVTFEARTPGVEVCRHVTSLIGPRSEWQPDLLLRVLTEHGGQSNCNVDDFLIGAPELACEVIDDDRRPDLASRLDDYKRHGVKECIVYNAKTSVVDWRELPSGNRLASDRSGVFKSVVFPGLWLDSKALARGDSAALIAAVEKGTKTAAHRKFVAKLKAARRP